LQAVFPRQHRLLTLRPRHAILFCDSFAVGVIDIVSPFVKPLTVEEFLAWERSQPARYEFDGIQPVAMTGGTLAHVRTITRLASALVNRVQPPCEAFGPELKVLTPGRVRYPDASVVCGAADDAGDVVVPTAVFEVLPPSTALTDRRVKALEYASVAAIMVYVLLEADRPEVTVLRRSTAWQAELIEGLDPTLALPEIGITVPLAAIYRR
jgi:Uma2 family endonuclease